MKRKCIYLFFFLALLGLPIFSNAQPNPDCLGFSLNSHYAEPDSSICLDVTVNGFSNIMGLQFSMQWDPAILTYTGATNYNLPGLATNNFTTAPDILSQGKVGFAWFDPNLIGVVRADGSTLFSLCFDATGDVGDRAEVLFSESPTIVEITLSDLSQVENYGFYGGSVALTADGTGPDLPTLSGCIENLDCAANTADFQAYPVDAAGAFAWTDNGGTTVSTTNTLPAATAGRYDLAYLSAEGAPLSAWIRLGNLAGFDFTEVAITPANCFTSSDGAIDLTLPDNAGGYVFTWSNGAVTEDIDGLAPGTYEATVTEVASDCSLTGQFEVPGADFLVAFSNECTIFNDDSASVDVTAVVWAGGVPPYTFEWSSGDVTLGNFSSVVTLPHPTNYDLTITDTNSCQYFSEPQITLCSGFPTPGTVRLFVTSQNVLPNESFCVPVRVSNFEGIEAASFSLNWDDDVVQLDSVTTPNLPNDWNYSFNLSGAGNGRLGFLAQSPGSNPFGYSLPDGNPLFELCFTADGESGYSALDFGSLPTPMEVTNGEDLLPVNPENGEILVTDGASELVISQTQESGEVGESICVPVTTTGFIDMSGLQGTLEWDPAVVTFDTIYPLGLATLNFTNTYYNQQPEIDQGRLRLVWLDLNVEGLSLPNGAPMFEICFTAVAPGNSPVTWGNDPLPILGYRSDLSPVNIAIISGGITVGDNLVWPGDTDDNEVVNHYDLLNIGLAFGLNGPPRNGATIDWTGQPALSWGMTTPASGIDFRYADTDGNGVVDAADALALSLNWLQTTDFFAGNDPQELPGFTMAGEQLLLTGVPLYVQPDTVQTGQEVAFPIILGEPGLVADQVYGLAFTIAYDTELVDPNSVFISFADSWLGIAPEDLLTFYRNDPDNGRMHLALTRTDGLNRDGYGPIAQLRLTIEDVIFKSDEFELALSVENPVLISFAENLLPVAAQQTITVVDDTSTDTDAVAAAAAQLRVYPVPARQELFLQAPRGLIQRVELYDPEGRAVRCQNSTDRLDLLGLAGGAYFLRVITDQGVISKRIIIMD